MVKSFWAAAVVIMYMHQGTPALQSPLGKFLRIVSSAKTKTTVNTGKNIL